MLTVIPHVLLPAEVAEFQGRLASAPWTDGKITAGYQSVQAKHNQQLPEANEIARQLGQRVLAALARNLLFMAAALPARIYPPLFNRYAGGQAFGTHIDNAIRSIPGTGERLRTDLSATLFLEDPASYDGGELVIEDRYGTQAVKLPAGHLVLYPATSLHQVRAVTRGTRTASFFWIESMIRDDGQRGVLFDIDMAIQRLRTELPEQHPSLLALSGSYHNLLRMWASL